MKEPLFTPPPWNLPSLPLGIGSKNIRVTYQEGTIAYIPWHMEANARLIAAAPELYAALKAISAEYKRLVDARYERFSRCIPAELYPEKEEELAKEMSVWETADAALKKARGESGASV